MGKPKNKGRKGQVEEFENDSDVELETENKQETDEKPELKSKAAGKKKKGKKKDEDWDDDVAAEIEALSLEANKDNQDYLREEVEVQQKPKKKEKKKKKNIDSDEEDDQDEMKEEILPKSGGNKKPAATFQMLMMDSDENDMAGSDNDSGKEEEENIKIETVKEQQKQKKKKGKNKEKETNKGEEDIDALLAEIDKPAEKPSKKSKKKKNVVDEDNEIDQEVEIQSKMANQVVSIDDFDDEEYDKKKKKKKGKKGKDENEEKEEEKKEEEKEAGEGEGEEEEGTMKTAAQKRKEKRDREKLKKQQEKKKQKQGGKTEEKEISETKDTTAAAEGEEGEKAEEDEEKEGKKKKKKGEKEEKKKKKAPVAAIKAHLQKVQEEEERLRREEEERIRKEEEAIRLREEQKRIEEEKKQKKKQKEKERKERLRQEGKLLTEKQKQDRKRAQQMLEQMKAQGIELPNKDEVPKEDVPKKRPVYFERKRKNKQQQQTTDEAERTPSPLEDVTPTEPETPDEQPADEEVAEKSEKVTEESEEEEIKDAWDVESDDEEKEGTQKQKPMEIDDVKQVEKQKEEEVDEEEESEEEEEEDEESSEEEDDDSEEESEEESSEEDEGLSPIEIAKERIMKRKEEAEKKRTTDVLRAPVVCVLGHVDTGKTKILDKLRRTHVQDGEAGGITQQIGATNVPAEAIMEQTKMCKDFQKSGLKIPGLLIIDTPGHESFSNLRSRGSSLCDIAILVVDIMHGLEPQTIESINLLKLRKTPFVVALNKIDRLYQWKPMPHTDVQNTIKKQTPHTKSEFEERARDAIVQFAEQGLNAALFYENKNPKEYISLIPTSAHSGDGMGNLIALISELSQTMLAKRISFCEDLQATVMEVKALPGLGTTIDVILVNGKLKEGDQMVVPGTEGPIVTQIRGLLMPQPMKEIRVKSQWEHHKEVCAAQGVKIIAKDLEKALAGLPVYVAEKQDEVEYYKEELSIALKEVLGSIKLAERGVFVQASTLGSLEALLEFLRTSKIPYAGINIGPVHKKDIMKASVMLEHDSQYAVILAFDVRVEREAQEMADSVGVRIFTADIIYHLFDSFMAFRDELKKRKQEEFKHIAVFPCKLRVMPQFIFNSRDPIVMGVVVEAGFVKEGTPICIPSKEFIDIGRVVGIENNHKPVDMAKKGQEVCVKIDPIPGEAPKMYGRHFDHTDLLISKISRQSIDAVKDYFRDEMGKADWQLIVELKKLFQII